MRTRDEAVLSLIAATGFNIGSDMKNLEAGRIGDVKSTPISFTEALLNLQSTRPGDFIAETVIGGQNMEDQFKLIVSRMTEKELLPQSALDKLRTKHLSDILSVNHLNHSEVAKIFEGLDAQSWGILNAIAGLLRIRSAQAVATIFSTVLENNPNVKDKLVIRIPAEGSLLFLQPGYKTLVEQFIFDRTGKTVIFEEVSGTDGIAHEAATRVLHV